MKRIQRSRAKGWRMPPDAVYVGRPSLWGNPWAVGDLTDLPPSERAAAAVRWYRQELEHWGLLSDYAMFVTERRWEEAQREIDATGAQNMGEAAAILLRGKTLVCWCPLDQPCHADVLLELASPVPVSA